MASFTHYECVFGTSKPTGDYSEEDYLLGPPLIITIMRVREVVGGIGGVSPSKGVVNLVNLEWYLLQEEKKPVHTLKLGTASFLAENTGVAKKSLTLLVAHKDMLFRIIFTPRPGIPHPNPADAQKSMISLTRDMLQQFN